MTEKAANGRSGSSRCSPRASHPQYGGQLIGLAFADQRVEADERGDYREERDPGRKSIRVDRTQQARPGRLQSEPLARLIKACVTKVVETAPRLSVEVKIDYRPGVTGALRAKVDSLEERLSWGAANRRSSRLRSAIDGLN